MGCGEKFTSSSELKLSNCDEARWALSSLSREWSAFMCLCVSRTSVIQRRDKQRPGEVGSLARKLSLLRLRDKSGRMQNVASRARPIGVQWPSMWSLGLGLRLMQCQR